VIYVGIDDTDTLDSRGTNQLAKAMSRAVSDEFLCLRILRHQLLEDPRVPCTSKNGSASLVFAPRAAGQPERTVAGLASRLRGLMQADFIAGSDPGLCVATEVDARIIAFGQQCQRELVSQRQARDLAARHGVFLEGLGGTSDGVVGALAAVGLSATNNDGRVVQWGQWDDDLSGRLPVEVIHRRGIDVQVADSSTSISRGEIDIGNHLRPNWRAGRCVLFAIRDDSQPTSSANWKAVRLP